MSAEIVLGITAIVFGFAPIILRSNAIFMFLTLCAGELLAKYTSQDIAQIVGSLFPGNVPVFSVVQISLLVVTPIIVLFAYKKTVTSDILLQIIAAVSATVVAFGLIVAKLPYEKQAAITSSAINNAMSVYFGVAVAAGLFVSVCYLLIKKPKHDKHKKHHKSSHH
jgi:hypothetical protein